MSLTPFPSLALPFPSLFPFTLSPPSFPSLFPLPHSLFTPFCSLPFPLPAPSLSARPIFIHPPCALELPALHLIRDSSGDASHIHIMYTNHVHQGHNPQVLLHSPYPAHMSNGHAPNSHHSPHQPHHPPQPPPPVHRAQAPTAKERITVQAVPSVTVQNNQLVVGDSRSSQYMLSCSLLSPSSPPR